MRTLTPSRTARTAMATIEQQALRQLPAADVAGFRNVVRALEKITR